MQVWEGWVFGHALHPLGHEEVPSFEEHLGDLERHVSPYAVRGLVLADRHTYEVAANWKVIAENYHECYHCPLIHPELCQVTPPDSGDNYDLPGAWVGGAMFLREGMATMSMTGELAATPLPGVDPTRVEYLHLLPNLLVSAHPDYVMAHRMVPTAPGRTWVECSWFVAPGRRRLGPDARGAVEFWDVTNQQDWAACECVQRGLASPHFSPGPFAPKEDAVADFVSRIGRAYARRTVRAVSRGAAGRPAGSPLVACVAAGLVDAHRVGGCRPARRRTATTKVGSLTLRGATCCRARCAGRSCGSGTPRTRRRDRSASASRSSPHATPRVRRSARVVPHEGGPGYSTTGHRPRSTPRCTARLLRRRNLLLVDQRGTGRSAGPELPRAAGPQDRLQRRRAEVRPRRWVCTPTTTRPSARSTTSPG